jgi:hypothetical protein
LRSASRAKSLVITRPFPASNVGSNLASLAGAVWLARQLDRTLIVDWRGQVQLRDPSLNYFPEFFDAPREILGVPVLYAPLPEVDYAEITPTEPGYAHLIGTGQSPVPEEHLVLTTYHGPDRLHPGPDGERFRFLRSFYRCLRPAPEIRERVDGWWAENLDGSFVVGLNLRTGNGRYFGKGQQFEGRVDVSLFADSERLLRVLGRACRARTARIPGPLRDGSRIFYATDSKEMSEFLAALPGSTTRRTTFPPPGSGDTFVFEDSDYTDRDSIVDTLADMFLLARCDALVYNSSVFNQYARVLNGNFGGNQAHLETLFPSKRLRVYLAAARRRLRRR